MAFTYYRINRTSTTGRRVTELEKKGDVIIAKISNLAGKYGFIGINYRGLWGGVYSVVFLDGKTTACEPVKAAIYNEDTKKWAGINDCPWLQSTGDPNVFLPNTRSSSGKSIAAKLKRCGVVYPLDITNAMEITRKSGTTIKGISEWEFTPGLCLSNPKYIGVYFDAYKYETSSADFEVISETEYRKLKGI